MKKVLAIISLILLTGCNCEYNLVITDKQEVKENFKIYINNNQIDSSFSSIDEYLDYYKNLYLENDGFNSYKIDAKKSTPNSYFIVNRKYKNLNDYVSSLTFKSMFYYANIEKIGKYTTFTTSENSYIASLKEEIMQDNKFDSFTIKIKFYNEVVDSNADEIDLKNNIYIWNVNENDEENYIYFKTSSKVKYWIKFKDWIENNIISIIIVLSAAILVTVALAYICIKSKKNNEV